MARGNRYLLTVPEAGRLLGLSRTQSYEAAHRGDLPIVRVNNRMYVPMGQLEALVGRPIDPRDLDGGGDAAA